VTIRTFRALALAILIAAGADAQLQTLSQSTNSTTVTPGSIACAVGNPAQYTVDNGYFRSYPLSTLPSNIDIVSISFGVENVASTQPGGFPLQIRLYNDANGGQPSPFSSLVLRHTESFTLPTSAIPQVVTQALTGSTVTFATNETLVVELFSPTGATSGNLFFIGSNALGQSAPGYLRAPNCGVNDPTALSTIGYPNMHVILNVNYVPSGQTVTFPGTGEDFTIFSAVNANPLSTGIGNSVKTVTAGDNLTVKFISTGGTFNFREIVVVAQGYPTGAPPFPPAAPNIHVSIPGLVILLGGASGPFGPVLLPPVGVTMSFLVPPGLAGTSALIQGAIITWTAPFALNGLYASTDAHEINVL
jgi:hypothetical protein